MYGTKKKTTIVATEHVYVCMSSMCAYVCKIRITKEKREIFMKQHCYFELSVN